MTLYLDISTGKFRRSLTGADLPAVKFYVGDVMTLSITLVDGTTVVTSTQLTGGKQLRIAIRPYPLTAEPLAVAVLSTLVGQVVSGVLDLTDESIKTFLYAHVPISSPSSACILEAQIENNDQTSVETVSQSAGLIARNLIVGTVGVTLTTFSGDELSTFSGNPITTIT